MTTYLGPVGNLLAIPDFGERIQTTLAVPMAVHQIAGARGGRVVDRVGAAKRTYSLGTNGLTQDELGIIEGLYLGAYGPGPFALLEEWRRNLLSVNQSTGTETYGDTTGFVAVTGAITSTTAQADLGSRSLAWAVTAATQRMVTGTLANVTNAAPTVDIPVLPSTVYSARVRGRLSTSTGTIRLDAYWFDKAGAAISNATGTATAMATGSFTDAPILNTTSPSTAALLRLSVTNTVMGAAQTIYLDQWQLQQKATLDAWTVGTGVPRVSFTDDLAQTYPIFPNINATFTLTEV